MNFEAHFAAGTHNRSRDHITAHPQPLAVNLVAHRVHFRYRLVIALALIHAADGEPRQHTDDYSRQSPELHVGLHTNLLNPSKFQYSAGPLFTYGRRHKPVAGFGL